MKLKYVILKVGKPVKPKKLQVGPITGKPFKIQPQVLEHENVVLIFSHLIMHSDMAQMCKHNLLRNGCVTVENYSAGFLSYGGTCEGRSESLNLGGQPDDNEIIRNHLLVADEV